MEYFPTLLRFESENSDVQFDHQQSGEFRRIIGGGGGQAATTTSVVALHPLALQHGAPVSGRLLEYKDTTYITQDSPSFSKVVNSLKLFTPEAGYQVRHSSRASPAGFP